MLLAEGANKDAADNGGATPMIIAAEIGHAEVLKMLLAAGANKDAAANDGVLQGISLPRMAMQRSCRCSF